MLLLTIHFNNNFTFKTFELKHNIIFVDNQICMKVTKKTDYI